MNDIKFHESSYFTVDKIEALKGGKKIYVIFPTSGNRESDLIYNKISALKKIYGNIIDRIFLAHRRKDIDITEATEIKAQRAFDKIDILICNSIPVPDMDKEIGKGADMRRAVYHINKRYSASIPPENVVLVFLDSDVVTEYFGLHFVLGLAGGILEGADFAKASFWREMGRVKKFVAQPIFSLIDHPKLKKLTQLSYPLSGEVAGTLNFFNSVNFWQMYGIETGMNIDACLGDYRIADVNLGLYNHEHRPDVDIQKMSFEIMRAFFLKLIDCGIIELKNNAVLSDIFMASFIDENGNRQKIEFELNEKKYQPIKNIL
ncbi:MAG: hypothetical protein MUC95_02415 [Spirochaetes bacterium]|nr:hypothetical protein [Spirochaetota bacterium]